MSATQITVVRGSATRIDLGKGTSTLLRPRRYVTRLTLAAFIPVPAGAPGGTYEHPQASAADEWIVNHNLGYKPNISVLTVGGVKVVAEVLHISNNQARVYFDNPMAGTAVCS